MPIFFKTIKSFSSTYQGKFPIFKADWKNQALFKKAFKFKHFSRSVGTMPLYHLFISDPLTFRIKTTLCDSYKYKSMNLTKPRTYINAWANNYCPLSSNLKALALQMASGMWERCQLLMRSSNRMAWQWAETLVEIRGTLADIWGISK